MKLTANDTLHISSVGPDNIAPNEAFEVADDVGETLIARGLAKPHGKSEQAHEHKMEHAPQNKGRGHAKGKAK